MKFNEKLKAARKRKNLTQQQLAEALNVSRSLIARWEYGDVCPNIDYLKSLSNILEVPYDELLDNEDKIDVIVK